VNPIEELAGLLPPAPYERELPRRQLHKTRLLAALEAEPEARPALRPLTRRRGWTSGRLIVPFASAAAVLIIAALAVALPHLTAGSGPGQQAPPPAGGWLSGPPAGPPAGSTLTSTRHWTVPAASFTSIAVSTNVGPVTVAGDGGSSAAVTATPAYQGTAPVITSQIAGGALAIRATCPDEPHCQVALTLHVPSDVPVKALSEVGGVQLTGLSGHLGADTSQGTIRLIDLRGQIDANAQQGDIYLSGGTGSLTATTDQGNITLAGFSGPVTARSSEGNIAAHLSSPRATLTTQQGTVDVVFWTVPGQVFASSQQGAVIIRVPSSAVYQVIASTQLGSTSVTVPRAASSRHVIRASTQQGSVTVTG
jgi:hypothetical protein